MYLHKVYTCKSLFLSLLAPQAIFFSFCTSFRSDFAVKITISKGKDENPTWKFSHMHRKFYYVIEPRPPSPLVYYVICEWSLTCAKIWVCSKIRSELGDRAPGSWKLPRKLVIWRQFESNWDNFTKGFIWENDRKSEFPTSEASNSELKANFWTNSNFNRKSYSWSAQNSIFRGIVALSDEWPAKQKITPPLWG